MYVPLNDPINILAQNKSTLSSLHAVITSLVPLLGKQQFSGPKSLQNP